ncbi:MAG: AAA family ATPase [Odoribacter sp.]
MKDGVIKNGIIYGPNGSGKTNFGLALFDLVNHISQKWKKADYYTNFVFAGNPNAPVKFEYTFKFDTDTVVYIYSKNQHGALVAESLKLNQEAIFS